MFDAKRNDNGDVRLRGRFDASKVAEAAAVLDGITDSCTVDCSELTYISSAGLGLLFATQRRLVDCGAGLRLVDLNPHIREIFEIAGFDHVFELE
jgi:anti-sigma B factor antagonist